MCAYISTTLSAHCRLNLELSKCTKDYEIMLVDLTKPGLKHMSVICIYRPPNGTIKSCIDYLKIVFQSCKSEIWL